MLLHTNKKLKHLFTVMYLPLLTYLSTFSEANAGHGGWGGCYPGENFDSQVAKG